MNKLICGDNLEVLATLDAESVDLIYIDPPFFSNRNYELIWGDEAEIRSFEDRWEGGIEVYIDWMRQRVIELHRVLKQTGSFYLHCDWHAAHYLKVMCDDIFGYNKFVNEIIWCYSQGGKSKNHFGRKHDNIFYYCKSENYTFNGDAVRIEMKSGKTSFGGRLETDKDGRKYRLVYGTKNAKGETKYYKYYLDEGKIPEDYWTDINSLQSGVAERIGYPTQKPEKLLERIIKASSNKGDVVLDAFCGCGTSISVSQKLNRKWIGIDISPSAIALVKNRLAKIVNVEPEKIADIIGMPTSVDQVKTFKPFDFQYWVVNEMRGTPSPKKVGDMGIDGLSLFNHYPIQVKQSEGVGRPVVDSFETAMRRYFPKGEKEMHGYIVAFSFTSGAREEVARVKKEGMKIELITVQNILDGKFKMHQTLNEETLF